MIGMDLAMLVALPVVQIIYPEIIERLVNSELESMVMEVGVA
jgi:hypothetical protein